VPRPRRRAVGLVIGAGLLFLIGTNVQAGWLFVLAACIAGSLVAGMILPVRMVRGLQVRRRGPAEVHQNDEVLVELTVENRSRGMRLGVVVDDPSFEPTTMAFPALRSGDRVEITSLRRAGRRGLQGTEPVTVRSSAPFGVGERRRKIAIIGATSETLVLPAVIPLGPLTFVRPAATNHLALHSAPRRGHGPEYFGIREYRPGDSMRHVHWPSTARTDTVMVREFEEEQTHRLAIVIDASWDADPAVGDGWTPLDRVCCAAASVALAALAQGHGTRLLIPGDDGLEVLARADGSELLRRLALVTQDRRNAFTGVVEGLHDALRGVETVVLAFPARRGLDVDLLTGSVRDLAARIAHVVALPVEVSLEESAAVALPAGRWTELEERLRGAGADVYPWRVGDDLAALLAPDVTPRMNEAGVTGP
jgi:uncharacterized protein (DUF58 family)